jgi:hypothetical protein
VDTDVRVGSRRGRDTYEPIRMWVKTAHEEATGGERKDYLLLLLSTSWHHTLHLKMEAMSSKTEVSYHITWLHSPEALNLSKVKFQKYTVTMYSLYTRVKPKLMSTFILQ